MGREKFLYVVDSLDRFGATVQLDLLTAEIAREHEVHVVVLCGSNRLAANDARTVERAFVAAVGSGGVEAASSGSGNRAHDSARLGGTRGTDCVAGIVERGGSQICDPHGRHLDRSNCDRVGKKEAG